MLLLSTFPISEIESKTNWIASGSWGMFNMKPILSGVTTNSLSMSDNVKKQEEVVRFVLTIEAYMVLTSEHY